ncbi:MAG TPA: PPOX class F420-dependent oxidoreductase [Anaerolineales bacterium]
MEKSKDSNNQFTKQKYINIETFRRNGEGVMTPVWFIQDGHALYVNTEATSGKAKRIRTNGKVNVAPCKMDGRLAGVWVPAEACELTDPTEILRFNSLLNKKYGLLKKLFDGQRTRRGSKDTVLEIRLTG